MSSETAANGGEHHQPQTAAAQFSTVLIIFILNVFFYRLSLMLLVGVCDYAEFTILEEKEAIGHESIKG